MLKIEKEQKRLVSFSQLSPVALSERPELREIILNSPNEFFAEIGQKLFAISETVWPPQGTPIRADILALDQRGNVVAVVLPNGGEKTPLPRAIACLGLMANWSSDGSFKQFLEENKKDLESFLDVSVKEVNRQQRAILIAEDHDMAVLTAAKWLRERSGLEVRCVRVLIGVDSQKNEYLSCQDLSETHLPIYRLLGSPSADLGRLSMASVPHKPESGEERRKQLRTRKYSTQHLKVAHGGQVLLISDLVDLSDGGLGAEIGEPLPVGSNVTLTGDLHSSESAVKLDGRARVAYCLNEGNGGFRVGLSFEDIRCENLY